MKGKSVVKVFLVALLVTYPLFVFLALVVFGLPIRIVSIGMMIIAIAYFGFFHSKGKRNWSALIMGVLGIVVLLTKSELVLKFYPICITIVFLIILGLPLLRGKPFITQLALMMDTTMENHPGRGILERSCFGLNCIWVFHLLTSLTINFFITFGSTLQIWTIYNALVSYLVMGVIIILHFPIVALANKKASKLITSSDFRPKARPKDYVVGYYGETYSYRSSSVRTWKDLFSHETEPEQNDLWIFTVRFAEAIESGSEMEIDGRAETIDRDAPWQDEVMRLWNMKANRIEGFRLLPCPPKKRIVDLFKKLCEKL